MAKAAWTTREEELIQTLALFHDWSFSAVEAERGYPAALAEFSARKRLARVTIARLQAGA